MSKLLFNLKNMSAFKGLVLGIKKSGPLVWLRNELVPTWHVKYTGFFGPGGWLGFTPEFTQEVFKGWFGLHLGIAVGLAFVLGINWWQMALIAFVIEVVQFLKTDAAFVLPVNSLLDIGSYTLWVYLYTRFVGFSLFNLFG